MIFLGLIIATACIGFAIGFISGGRTFAKDEASLYIVLILGVALGVGAGTISPWGDIMCFIYAPIAVVIIYFTLIVGAGVKNGKETIKPSKPLSSPTIVKKEISKEITKENNIHEVFNDANLHADTKDEWEEDKIDKLNDGSFTRCPVCNNNILHKDNFCSHCGFNELHYEFISEEDALQWIKTSVKPYKKKWLENNNR